MAECRWTPHVEAWFDGEKEHVQAGVEAHIASCPACTEHIAFLREVRAYTTESAAVPGIADGQMGAFLDGMWAGVETAAPHHRPFWAWLSLSAAALLMALATYFVFTDFNSPDRTVEATVVESAYSELQGASVDVEISEDGAATVWVNNAPDDILYGNP